MTSERWEVGSEFHDPNHKLGQYDERIAWPGKLVYFLASGRLPVLLLKRTIGERVLHYPDFFCQDVIEYWQQNGINTKPYRVHFFDGRINVDFSSVPRCGVVLAVNYFGTDEGEQWSQYKSTHDILLIEDHTHAPVSLWARKSTADYAFSSLRKTLAVSDGCAFWSPNNSTMPNVPTQYFDPVFKKRAMALKQRYLLGGQVDKVDFLTLFSKGEEALADGYPYLASKDSYNRLIDGFPTEYINLRRSNLDVLFNNLSKCSRENIELLDFSAAKSPFGAVFKCRNGSLRSKLRAYLIEKNIYCAVHWPQKSGSVSEESMELSECLITVPIDQRYTSNDMRMVAKLINRFFVHE